MVLDAPAAVERMQSSPMEMHSRHPVQTSDMAAPLEPRAGDRDRCSAVRDIVLMDSSARLLVLRLQICEHECAQPQPELSGPLPQMAGPIVYKLRLRLQLCRRGQVWSAALCSWASQEGTELGIPCPACLHACGPRGTRSVLRDHPGWSPLIINL